MFPEEKHLPVACMFPGALQQTSFECVTPGFQEDYNLDEEVV